MRVMNPHNNGVNIKGVGTPKIKQRPEFVLIEGEYGVKDTMTNS